MYRIYEIWKAYALFVVEAIFACQRRIEHLPDIVSFGLLLVPLIAVEWFLPRWASLSIFAAIGLPMLWFFGALFCVYFTYRTPRKDR